MKTQSDWDAYYMSLVEATSKLSYAPDKQVGAILVCLNQSLFFSYNGTVPGSCNDTVDHNGATYPHVYHAEAAVLGKAAKAGISTAGSTLYCNLSPCIHCAKLIQWCGVMRVVYTREYKDTTGVDFLRQHNVALNQQLPHSTLIPESQLRNTCLQHS